MGTDFLKFDANWPEKLMKPNLISLLIMTPTAPCTFHSPHIAHIIYLDFWLNSISLALKLMSRVELKVEIRVVSRGKQR